MPFRSKRQQRFMYATKPKGVNLKEWADETDFSKLPERVRKKKKKKDKSDKNDTFQGDESLEAHGDPDINTILEMASVFYNQTKAH